MPSNPVGRSSHAGVQVRQMTDADVDFAARLHLQCLPHGFFPQLGLRFLRSYYRSFVAGPHAVALVAWNGTERLGLLVGTVHNRVHYRWVVRMLGWQLAVAAGGGLLGSPKTAVLFVRTRLRRYARGIIRHVRGRRPTPESDGQAHLDVAVLTHVAVDPRARRRGVGGRLVQTFTAALVDRGATRILLVTEPEPDGASAFYERLGWHAEGRRPAADGRVVAVYSLLLDSSC